MWAQEKNSSKYDSISNNINSSEKDYELSLLYQAVKFIIQNAETKDEKDLAAAVTFMMNTGRVQFDDVTKRYPKPNIVNPQSTLAFFDLYKNTVTGESRQIIVIDLQNAINNDLALANMIETLAHEGWHKVQFDRGKIALTEDNCIQLNYEKKEGWTTWDVFTEMELEAYNMGLNMHNKYTAEKYKKIKVPYTFEQIRALYPNK